MVLLVLMILDVAVNLVAPKQKVEDHFDHLRVQPSVRPLLNPIKIASILGLFVGLRWRRLGAITAAALIGYFAFALQYHRRVRDNALETAPAVLYGGVSARALLAFLLSSERA